MKTLIICVTVLMCVLVIRLTVMEARQMDNARKAAPAFTKPKVML